MLPWEAEADPPSPAASRAQPFIEIPPEARRADLPPLDPNATPRPELGKLRARYLPLWTQDLDLAFPPHVCGTAWELDGIAVPVAGVNVSHYGDPATMAALAVMRYEHLLASAFAHPTRLAQLCIAVAAVDPARQEALSAYTSAVTGLERAERDRGAVNGQTGSGSEVPQPRIASAPLTSLRDPTGEALTQDRHAAFPAEVTLIAVSSSSVVAVACLSAPTARPVLGNNSHSTATAPTARLRAYDLMVSQGIEDTVNDLSLRVARTQEREAFDCAGTNGWISEWHQHVQDWIAEGQVWLPLDQTLTVESLCRSSAGSGGCPFDWSTQ